MASALQYLDHRTTTYQELVGKGKNEMPFAEVEVDLDTFEVKVLRFWQAADVGKAINPLNCVAQIEGGVVMGIGSALHEEMVIDESGKVRNPSFLDYHLVTSLDTPELISIIVECDEPTWRRAGLDRMGDGESRAYCERVFAPDLGGEPLVSNKSVWRNFPLLSNENWVAGNAVLIGDALRTGHFSIGSGTRLAFDDAIALSNAFQREKISVKEALADFEKQRRPVVEKIVAAANRSSYWYETFPERMKQEPWQLAYDYMTRSGRMTDERLGAEAPAFYALIRERLTRSGTGSGSARS